MEQTNHRYRRLLVALMLAFWVLACYWPVQHFGFINYDDPLYVTENPRVQAGLTGEGVLWAFKDLKSTNWHPLTWLSHMADWELFGGNAAGHHWTNVLFHLLNAILLFHLLLAMTGALWRSALVAALFAVHPLNVESVVWIAERKNLLSSCLGLLAILFYVQYVRRPTWKRYLALAAAFALSLMAKPMLVTLPFVLLLLDFWPLNRFHAPVGPANGRNDENGRPPGGAGSLLRWEAFGRSLVDKIPLLLMSAGSALITLVAAEQGGAVKTLAHFPLAGRLANALHAYAAYIGKFFWPRDLAIFYPHREGSLLWQTLPAVLLIAAVTALVVHQRKVRPYLAVGWFWFLGTLVPVIGLVQVGLQGMADRYAYIPCIGLLIMLVWGIADFVRGKIAFKTAALLLILPVLAASLTSRHQIGFWQNSRILFTHAIEVTQANEIAHNNLAYALFQEGDTAGAIDHFRRAVAINPWYMTAHNNLGIMLARQGKSEEAIASYGKTLKINPRHPVALLNMGLALESLGRLDEADGFYRTLIGVEPDHAQAHQQLGVTAVKRGAYDRAVVHFREALRLRPGDRGLGAALSEAVKRSALKKELDQKAP